jgi:hypothetical protein
VNSHWSRGSSYAFLASTSVHLQWSWLVLNDGGKVVPVMGSNKVWRTYKLVMLSMVSWLTTIRYVMATRTISTKHGVARSVRTRATFASGEGHR